MVQKAMLLMLLALIINALSIPSQKILQFHRFLKVVILCQAFVYKPWLVKQPRQITLYLTEKTFFGCCQRWVKP